MIGLGLAAVSVLAAYDCQLEAPRAVSISGATASASEIGLPPMSLHFTVAIEQGDPLIAKVNWSGDPIQLAGQVPAISTAANAYAFSAYSGGPCLFTEQECISQVNLVEADNGTAHVIVTPVALAKDSKSGQRAPFAVIAQGQCSRTDQKK